MPARKISASSSRPSARKPKHGALGKRLLAGHAEAAVIRDRLGLSRKKFAEAFGFDLAA